MTRVVIHNHRGFARDEFRESEHPRAHGKFAKKGGGETGGKTESKPETESKPALKPEKPGVKAKGKEAADNQKDEWSNQSPFDSVEKYASAGPANQDKLVKAADEISNCCAGVTVLNPGWKGTTEKGMRRLAEKIATSRAPTRISDAVRVGFAIQHPEDGDRIIDGLAKKFEVADEGWFQTQEGYFDRKALVRFADGMMAEIQIHEPSMYEAKEKHGGHEAYENLRSLPFAHPDRKKYIDQMKNLYGTVNNKLSPVWQKTVFAPPKE